MEDINNTIMYSYEQVNAVENMSQNNVYNEYEEDVPTYNYEDEDAFSDVNYDSDECYENLTRRRPDEEDSEDEIWEVDEEEDDKIISNEMRLQIMRDADRKQCEGLSVLEGKLNWLEMMPNPRESAESDLDVKQFPSLIKPVSSNQTQKVGATNKKTRSPNTSPKFVSAPSIKVTVGKKTYLGFEHIICKALKEGMTCLKGDACKYSHDLPKPPIDYSTRLCNSIRYGGKM